MRLLLLGFLLVHTGCVTVQWNQVNIDEPVRQEDFAQIEVGRDDLGRCLEILGAPTLIENFDGDEQFALLWAWLNRAGWGFSVSTGRFSSFGSFRYSSATENLKAVRLLFDSDLSLLAKQQGMLSGLSRRHASR